MTEDTAGTGAGPLTDLSRALAATGQVVAGIGASQWQADTPCPGLDVRALLNHLVTGNLVFAARVGGGPAPDPDADQLGDDPLAVFRSAGDALQQAFAAPGVLTAAYAAPWGGTAPGVALVHVRVTEVLVHGWDLARATGQAADFPADVAERTLAGVRQQLTSRPEGPDAPFAPEVPVPADAPAIDRLAGFLGRACPPGPA